MTKRLLLLMGMVCVLACATPSQATFWNHDWNDKSWDINWDWGNKDWPEWDWGNKDWPEFDWPEIDWPKHDWPREHECNRWCGCKDNPVPEPATAGLAFMGLAALGFATRRRK